MPSQHRGKGTKKDILLGRRKKEIVSYKEKRSSI
jgi:hypothetical protein